MTDEEYSNLKVGDFVSFCDEGVIRYRQYTGSNSYADFKCIYIETGKEHSTSKVAAQSMYKLAYKKVKNTELARKMYPDHEVEGDFIKVRMV